MQGTIESLGKTKVHDEQGLPFWVARFVLTDAGSGKTMTVDLDWQLVGMAQANPQSPLSVWSQLGQSVDWMRDRRTGADT